ncbi:putative membrane protein [Gottschalkia acidurici 9a]|uniref:Membrane protein n=1 Tax=Gottschalkia acidurici (strain ATCC 7906 / DSM 604 / BCRC 14475 / CIP 104303 / KCTC 5404 / NCIMB 10678 / 9a) TaxID=1128398 RepID=K0B3K4_GOTA9|nr:ABC transporter permease [Gottschalkia acidurici]AFS79742.1 putative membrane protein [Gottschalkia acidurici 9a]
MINLFKIENKKMKKSGVLFTGLFFIAFSLFIGTSMFLLNREVFERDGNQIIGLWGQSAFYYSQIFYPIIISLMASICCNLEKKNKNWQRMRALPISNEKLILGKLFTLSYYLLLLQLIFYILYIVIAIILNLSIDLTISLKLLRWIIISWIGGITILNLQLFLSIKTNSFTAPIGIATGGSFVGFLLLFINNNLLAYFPYSQGTIGMRSRHLQEFQKQELLTFVIVNAILNLIIYFLSRRELNKKEY